MRKELEEIGIKVISLPDLTDENLFQTKYQISKSNIHPNAKAWEHITPRFIKAAGIK